MNSVDPDQMLHSAFWVYTVCSVILPGDRVNREQVGLFIFSEGRYKVLGSTIYTQNIWIF